MALVTDLLSTVDRAGTTYVANAYGAMAQALSDGGPLSVGSLMLTLYVIFWGIGIWQGTASGGPADHAFRLFRAFLIYTLATQWGAFQSLVYTAMNEGPAAIGNSLLNTVGSMNNTGLSINLTSVNAVQTALQNLWDTTGNAVAAFVKNAGITNPGPYVIATVLLIAMAILIGFGLFLIILSKIFMWLLLGLAPIFIVLLLFGVTSRFFSGWFATLVQYFVVQVMVYAFIAFYVGLTHQFFDRLNTANNGFTTTFADIAPIILVAIIGILLLHQLNAVAASIAGGIPMGYTRLGRVFSAAGNARIPGTNMLSLNERSAARRSARMQNAVSGYRDTMMASLPPPRRDHPDQNRLANQLRQPI
jgi:type IV secretion system protein VirB6